jgi:hypothetical protein
MTPFISSIAALFVDMAAITAAASFAKAGGRANLLWYKTANSG